MKLVAIILALTFSIVVQAFPKLKISRLTSCGICSASPDGSQARIAIERGQKVINVGVTTFVGCGATLSEPAISQRSASATIAVASDAPPSVSGCDASVQQEFSIEGLSTDVETIYYVQDGAVLGHIAVR